MCDADEIDIYSRKESFLRQTLPPGPPCAASQLDGLQDRNWVKEEAMSASLRGTTEPSTWFRCFFSLGVLPLPRSQGRLLRIRAAISGRCLSCVRVPQQRWSLSAANLHRSVLCELLGRGSNGSH